MRRPLVWLALAPFIACGELGAHAMAYELTGTPSGSLHHYLEHAPELLTLLLLVSVTVIALVQRMQRPVAWPFPVAAVAGFVLQEHLERFAHTGHIPWLVTSPVFLVGLLLQVPIAVAAWLVARWLGRVLVAMRPLRRPRVSRLLLCAPAPAGVEHCSPRSRSRCVRGPPHLQAI